MKAVLWADTIQFFIMMAGQLAIIICGTFDMGGIYKVWELAQQGGRTNLDK